jgi:hypothetical protein
VAKLTITEREMMQQHIENNEQSEFMAEYHTPDGVVRYVLMPGDRPEGHDLSMPTIAGPTSYVIQSSNEKCKLARMAAELH